MRPVILCGGAGTRLWPLSRQSFPKQFLKLTGDQSLLQQTATRVSTREFDPPIVVTAEEQRFFVKRELELAQTSGGAILLEPEARNTSPAVVFAAAWLSRNGQDELMLLMPADHMIGDEHAFSEALREGIPLAKDGAIVTFGATPTEANSQYGYIESGESLSTRAFKINRFVEKPAIEAAQEFFESGKYHWNAGIFLAMASTILEEAEKYLPEAYKTIRAATEGGASDGVFFRPDANAFRLADNISFDHGVMEKTSRGVVIPVRMDWCDVGSWNSAWQLATKDESENVTVGEVVSVDTYSSLLRSDGGPLIAALGLTGMAVVAVRDAVLVAPLDRVRRFKRAHCANKAIA